MNLQFLHKVKENPSSFALKVVEISEALGINPDWLMAAMNFESGLNPAAVNRTTGASGLIQFMPQTAIALGTTVEAIRNMSGIEQLDYVYNYLLPYQGKMKRLIDLYLSIFFPLAVGKPKDFVIQTKKLSASQIAKANPVFDLDNNGEITVAEIEEVFLGTGRKKK